MGDLLGRLGIGRRVIGAFFWGVFVAVVGMALFTGEAASKKREHTACEKLRGDMVSMRPYVPEERGRHLLAKETMTALGCH